MMKYALVRLHGRATPGSGDVVISRHNTLKAANNALRKHEWDITTDYEADDRGVLVGPGHRIIIND